MLELIRGGVIKGSLRQPKNNFKVKRVNFFSSALDMERPQVA